MRRALAATKVREVKSSSGPTGPELNTPGRAREQAAVATGAGMSICGAFARARGKSGTI